MREPVKHALNPLLCSMRAMRRAKGAETVPAAYRDCDGPGRGPAACRAKAYPLCLAVSKLFILAKPLESFRVLAGGLVRFPPCRNAQCPGCFAFPVPKTILGVKSIRPLL